MSTAHAGEDKGQGQAANPFAKLSDNAVVAEVQDFWHTMLPLLEQPLHYAGSFFADIRRPAFTLLWVFAGVVLLKFGGTLATAVDSMPLFGSLMELVGLWVVFDFGRRNLLTGRDRQQLSQTYQTWRRNIFGPDTAPTPVPAAMEAAKLRLVPTVEGSDQAPVSPTPAEASQPPQKLFAGVTGTVQVLIPLTGVVDVEALRAKVEKDLAKVEAEIKALSGRLSNPDFVEKAPADVVQRARNALAEAEAQATILTARLAML